MDLTFALITDMHFGPPAGYDGKVRKLTEHGPRLAEAFVARMNAEVRPDLVFNLGDDIQDDCREVDLATYRRAIAILSGCAAPVRHVAGNHDLIHMTEDDLRSVWGHEGPLYYSFDWRGVHFVVLQTHETKDVHIRIDAPQLAWLEADLVGSRAPVIVLMHHAASEQDTRGNRWFYRSPHLALVQERRELRRILSASGRVRAVFNGHLHWNHFDLCDGIPFVTVQSLVENLDEDAPGRPAATHAVVRLTAERLLIEIAGNDPARYQIELGRLRP